VAVAVAHHEDQRRPAINQLGLWLFFFSETFLFSALGSARFYLAGVDRPEEVNQALGLGITSILLLSSFTAYQAEASMARGDRQAFGRFLLATIALGLVFVAGVGVEWTTAEWSVSEPYGTAFFSMTGLHASHVISGIVLLGLVYLLAQRGRFSAESHWGVEASIKYWHFVDVVWVFFYPILYLVSL
jgi:cytochrome c oxidase subunit 3